MPRYTRSSLHPGGLSRNDSKCSPSEGCRTYIVSSEKDKGEARPTTHIRQRRTPLTADEARYEHIAKHSGFPGMAKDDHNGYTYQLTCMASCTNDFQERGAHELFAKKMPSLFAICFSFDFGCRESCLVIRYAHRTQNGHILKRVLLRYNMDAASV